MNYSVAIGVSQNFLTGPDYSFRQKVITGLNELKLPVGICSFEANTITTSWRFENILTDDRYIRDRAEIMLRIINNDPVRVTYFEIIAHACSMNMETLQYELVDSDEKIVISCPAGRNYTIMHCLRTQPKVGLVSLLTVAQYFQTMCEWFTIQTSAYKKLKQAHTALVKHHRLADAREDITDATTLLFQNLRFPPCIF
jgi:hypothetical protein